MFKTLSKAIDRWLARRAFNALRACMVLGIVGVTREEYDHGVETLDILRSKMYKDWNVKTTHKSV